MPDSRRILKNCTVCGGEFIGGRIPSGKSIKEILAELEAYNREHGTKYTYGQYIELIEGR